MDTNKAESPANEALSGANGIGGSEKRVGVIDKGDVVNAHQIQFWIMPCGDDFHYVIRSAYMPGGKIVRSAVLDSGAVSADYDRVYAEGNEAFLRLKS